MRTTKKAAKIRDVAETLNSAILTTLYLVAISADCRPKPEWGESSTRRESTLEIEVMKGGGNYFSDTLSVRGHELVLACEGSGGF